MKTTMMQSASGVDFCHPTDSRIATDLNGDAKYVALWLALSESVVLSPASPVSD
jgi:hypothetical protein